LLTGLILAGTLLTSAAAANPSRGRPKVVLDELAFQEGASAGAGYKKHLHRTLQREARRADWGAGRANRIEYRFYVTELSIEEKGEALLVRCSALGKLPKGKSAKSRRSYSGDKNQRDELVRRVLDIVAKGVITRLAELERVRRGDLKATGVRRPESDAAE